MGCDMSDDDTWPGPDATIHAAESWLASKARHPSTPDPLAVLYEEIKETKFSSPLYVNVEWLDLVEYHGGGEMGEAKAFETLSKLRNLFQ